MSEGRGEVCSFLVDDKPISANNTLIDDDDSTIFTENGLERIIPVVMEHDRPF